MSILMATIPKVYYFTMLQIPQNTSYLALFVLIVSLGIRYYRISK